MMTWKFWGLVSESQNEYDLSRSKPHHLCNRIANPFGHYLLMSLFSHPHALLFNSTSLLTCYLKISAHISHFRSQFALHTAQISAKKHF